MKKILLAISISIAFVANVAYAAPIYHVDRTILPESNNLYDLGTSTSLFGSARNWRDIFYYGNLVNVNKSDGCASWSSGVLTSLGIACGSGAGGGASPDWNKQTNFNVLTLTPTTTIPVWIKSNLYASSTVFISATTTAADIFYQKDTSCNNILEGDSLTDNRPAVQPNDWPSWMGSYSNRFEKCLVVNQALTGDTMQNIASTYAAQIQPYKPIFSSDIRTVYLWAGTNDLALGGDATSTFVYFKQFVQNARADGFKIVVFAALPRATFVGNSKETNRVLYNQLIAQNPQLYDRLIRPDLSLTNPNDATYYSDGTHLTALGGQIVAQIVATTLDYRPFVFMPGLYATSSVAYNNLILNPGFGSVAIGTSSPNNLPATLTLQATSTSASDYALAALGLTGTNIFSLSNTGNIVLPTSGATTIIGTSTVYGTAQLTVGTINQTVSSGPNLGNIIAAFGRQPVGGIATSSILIAGTGSNPVNDAGIYLMGTINAANNAGFLAACEWGGYDTAAFTGSHLSFGTATANTTCNRTLDIKNGKVGIGTTTPYATLSVTGGDTVSDRYLAISQTSTSSFPGIFLGPLGTTPSSVFRLDVNGSQGGGARIGTITIGNSGTDYGKVGYNYRMTGSNGSYLYNISDFADQIDFTSGDIILKTAVSGTAGNAITFSDRFHVLNSNGNVGIGTAAPSSQFTVSASNANTSLTTYQTSANASLTNTNTTNNTLSTLDYRMTNSAATDITGVMTSAQFTDHTSGSEDATYNIGGITAGTFANWETITNGNVSILNTASSSNYIGSSLTSTSTFASAVGIGTSTPGVGNANQCNAMLCVVNSPTMSNAFNVMSNANSSIFQLTNGGSVTMTNGTLTAGALASNAAVTASRLVVNGSTIPAAGIYQRTTNTLDGASNTTNAFEVDANQNFGISTTTLFATLSVNPIAGKASNQFVIGSSTATNFKIDNSGHIFAPNLTSVTGGTNRPACYVAATGELVDDTTSVCQVSSERFKHNINSLTVSALDIVNALKTVSYTPNDDALYDYKNTQYGFTAEQVASIDPHLAEYGQDGKPRTLDDRAILSVLAKSIQELSQKTGIVKAVHSAEENWQDILIGLLILGFIFQQYQIYKLKK